MGIEKQKSRNTITNIDNQYELTCKRCNLSRSEFSKKARLGCPECYKTFQELELKSITQKAMHHSQEHVGKDSVKTKENIKLSDKIKNLKIQISDAIKNENYEIAQKIRDEIKQLVKESNEKLVIENKKINELILNQELLA